MPTPSESNPTIGLAILLIAQAMDRCAAEAGSAYEVRDNSNIPPGR